MRAQRLILCGFGKVGQAFAQLLHERRELLQTRYALGLNLVAVVDIGGAALATRLGVSERVSLAGGAAMRRTQRLEAGNSVQFRPDRCGATPAT